MLLTGRGSKRGAFGRPLALPLNSGVGRCASKFVRG